jgi:hypothetical protein
LTRLLYIKYSTVVVVRKGDVMTQLQVEQTAQDTEKAGHRRLAGTAGIVTVAVGSVSFGLMGSVPVLGDSATDVATYFTANGGPHQAAVVIAALLAIPILLFMVGVYRALADSPFWAAAFLYGAVMMSATAGIRELLYALAVRHGDTGLDPAFLQVIGDGSQIAGATMGGWMAVTVGSVAVVSFPRGSKWYAFLSAVVAAVAIVSVIDTVNLSTGGALASLAFIGFIIWMLVSAIAMLRRPLLA